MVYVHVISLLLRMEWYENVLCLLLLVLQGDDSELTEKALEGTEKVAEGENGKFLPENLRGASVFDSYVR